MMRRFRMVAFVVFVALIAADRFGGKRAPPRGAPRIPLAPCHVAGMDAEARCGRYEVYENRAAARGRKIGLNVVVLPALGQPAEPDPVFLLAGGPGQSIVKAAPGVPFLGRLLRHRDVVLVDQRGTGESAPLSCDALDRETSDTDASAAAPEVLKRCLSKLSGDPRFYTTDLATADLDDVRAVLGYDRINLWGASYGTRAALAYMKMFPGRARTAVLDAVAPYSNRLPLYMARDAERAWGLLVADCASSPDCAAAFPDFPKALRRVYDRLVVQPARVRLRNPVDGADEERRISADFVMGAVRLALYSSDVSTMLPFAIARADAGDYGPLSAMAYGGKALEHTMSAGLLLSVVCSEDVPFIAPGEMPKDGWFARGPAGLFDSCATWPHGTISPELRAPTVSDTPTLLLSGALDPVTPPSWGDEAAKTLSHSLHLTIPGVGHGASGAGCVPRLIQTFVEAGRTDGLDTSCIRKIRRPPFVVGMAGPHA